MKTFSINKRDFLVGAGAVVGVPAFGQGLVDRALPGGPSARALSSAYPQKGAMIVQRERPVLLETPMDVFDQGVFTPNDRFFVRWHWSDFPTTIDPNSYRLKVSGLVARPLALSLAELMKLPRVEIAAVNQCSGNSRALFAPRVPGAQWRHGSMGNALWTGVRLRDVLARAGVKVGAVAVRFGGLDKAMTPDAPDFEKSLAIDHALDGEVMIAFAMNGQPLPLLNGFPLRLIVPGWFSTYWIKMLDSIEVLAKPDTGYWMAKAYRIPDTPGADVAPGATGFATRPIGAMIPRSWITNLADGARVSAGPVAVRGIAMGGDSGVAKVEVSGDGGRRWSRATLGADEGKYGFRRFDATVTAARGEMVLMTRCTNAAGVAQSMTANWNPGGYMRGVVEAVRVVAS